MGTTSSLRTSSSRFFIMLLTVFHDVLLPHLTQLLTKLPNVLLTSRQTKRQLDRITPTTVSRANRMSRYIDGWPPTTKFGSARGFFLLKGSFFLATVAKCLLVGEMLGHVVNWLKLRLIDWLKITCGDCLPAKPHKLPFFFWWKRIQYYLIRGYFSQSLDKTEWKWGIISVVIINVFDITNMKLLISAAANIFVSNLSHVSALASE